MPAWCRHIIDGVADMGDPRAMALSMFASLVYLMMQVVPYWALLEAYQLDIDDDELRRAPTFRADKDFDWGDRSQETELHRYYGIPPYWGGF